MEQIKNMLEERMEYLLKIKKEKINALMNVPQGSLRICSHGGRTQYYKRNDPKDFNGVYIRESEVSLAKALAQKDYDKRILHLVDREIAATQKYLANYSKGYPEKLYETLHKERQKLVEPIRISDKEYLQEWEAFSYQGKEFNENVPGFYTTRGERVRSKSEMIIADMLHREGIPYRYECPIYLKGWGKVYPDFTVLNTKKRKEIYWEHFGMMDDDEYVEKALHKVALYEQNDIFQGDKLIVTYETRRNPINQKAILRTIQHFLA